MELIKQFPIDLSFTDEDLQCANLNADHFLPTGSSERPYFEISPGSIATGPSRIFIPAISNEHKISKMIVYDYGRDSESGMIDRTTAGDRKTAEEFMIPFTEGIIYGGSTWYANEIWTVSDEMIEGEIVGCIERYSESGVKGENIRLPWMWGYELFQALGITIEKNLIHILTKRTGWLNGKKLENDYQIEKYNLEGNLLSTHNLNSENDNPVGLTDDGDADSETEDLFFVGNISDNKVYSYTYDIELSDQDFLLNPSNEIIHGIGYIGGWFNVLKYKNPIESDGIYPQIFIYGEGDFTIPSDIIDTTFSIVSLTESPEEQFDGIEEFTGYPGRYYQVNENTDQREMFLSSETVYSGQNDPNTTPVAATNLKLIPRYTIPGLRVGDRISDSRGRLFEILGFKEGANNHLQVLSCKEI